MSAALLAVFGAAGGMPPATLENLRVLENGEARAIVGSAWPDGMPQDEAGLYAMQLGQDDIDTLKVLAADRGLRAFAGEHGPIHSDSGRSSLTLGDGEGEPFKITWGAFAKPPDPLPAAVETMRRILTAVREHPVAVLRFTVEDDGDASADGVGLVFTLSNPGVEDVRHSVLLLGSEPPRVAALPPGEIHDPLVLSTYRGATPVALIDDPLREDVLAAGDERRLRATAELELGPGEHRLVVFARGTLEVIVDEHPLALEVFLISRFVTVQVGG